MASTRIAVLGTGLIGRIICEDLLDEPGFQILAIDGQDSSLARLPDHPRLQRRRADLGDPATVTRLAAEADLAVGAVPGVLGRGMQKGVLAAGRPLVDISFAPEDPLEFHDEVTAAGIPFVVDCGLAPGLSNLLVGRECSQLKTVDDVLILVGGLPLRRDWPWEYRFVFSPGDVIEEYTRLCHIRVAGQDVSCEPLTEIELVDFDGVGTLEAFLTDGLRTLLHTIPATNLKEKTLRYPGHADRMRALKDTGFFSTDPITVPGGTVAPRAVTESLFRDAMALPQGEREVSVLRVEVTGADAAGTRRKIRWDLQDMTDEQGRTSMSRTTGFPCAEAVRLVASGLWQRPGVSPPELLGAESGACEAMLAGMERRGIRMSRSQEVDPGSDR